MKIHREEAQTIRHVLVTILQVIAENEKKYLHWEENKITKHLQEIWTGDPNKLKDEKSGFSIGFALIKNFGKNLANRLLRSNDLESGFFEKFPLAKEELQKMSHEKIEEYTNSYVFL
jgi:hypothetical protein